MCIIINTSSLANSKIGDKRCSYSYSNMSKAVDVELSK